MADANQQSESTPSQQAEQDVKRAANEAKNAANKAKETAKKAKKAKQAAKKSKEAAKKGNRLVNGVKAIIKIIAEAFKLIGKLIKWLISFLGPVGFIILLIVILVIILIVIATGITMQITSGGYDSSNQTMTSYMGVSGDSFYGVRTLYYDNEETSKKLSTSYLTFTADMLERVNDYGITIELETQTTPMVTVIQQSTIDYANLLASTSYTELNLATKKIDHFGFRENETINEKDIVLNSLANSISNFYKVKDSSTGTILENSNNQADIKAAQKALNEAYDAHFGYMKNVCAKILIKDYLLNSEDEKLTLNKRHYISATFMPKQDITLKDLTLIYKVDLDNTVESNIIHKKGNNTSEEILAENTIDSSWFDTIALKTQSPNKQIELKEFTAIDTDSNIFQEGITIFELIQNGSYSTFFNEIEGNEYNENIASQINSEDYLMLKFNSTSSFNFIDLYAEYK